MEETRKTQLYEVHMSTAKMAPFAGFEMPLWYENIAPEHLAVRNDVGIFDISHMGRVIITGADAERYLNHIITRDVSKLSPNAAQYSVMCNPSGGIIDDFMIYRQEPKRFLVIPNASNRQKDYNWLVKNAKGLNVRLDDVSDSVAMIAVQGPKAEKTLQKISDSELSKIERFKCETASLANVEVFLARTGYTGEDGFEIFVWNAPLAHPDSAVKLWNAILEAGEAEGIKPCGLGARDTLRLEAGLCLYGNDIDETTTPLEAKLSFVVNLQKDDFVGKEALAKQKSEGVGRKRVGILMLESGIPRSGFEVLNDKRETIGRLTSGTYSPLLRCGIGMGYVHALDAQEGNTVTVKVRERLAKAKIVPFPLYDAEKYGSRRKTAV